MISFRYGQRHAIELAAATAIAAQAQVAKHITIDIDLRTFGGSALTSDLAVPKHQSADEIGAGIPSPTFPPGTRSFSRLPWPGRRSWALSTCSSA